MNGKNKVFNIILIAVIVFLGFRLVTLNSEINEKKKEIEELESEIRETELSKEEYESILSEENRDDLYKNIAEDYLDYGYYDEKIYKDINK